MMNRICIVTLAVITLASAQAQEPPEFDAVSIKPSTATRNGPVQFGPGRAFSSGVSASRMIVAAYHLETYQVIGVTGWIDSDWFTLEAKAEAPVDENQLRLMLRTLLQKRFKLVVHTETRETPVYALTVGKNGTKLREWKDGDPVPARVPPHGDPANWGSALSHQTVENFVRMLNLPGANEMYGFNRPILDETGLKGVYLFNYGLSSNDDYKTDVIENQLGLKLESRKAPVDVLVIDHIEKPTPN